MIEDTWPVLTEKQNPEPGDRLVIWKAKGRTLRRGVVGLGEVLTAPAVIPPNPQSIPFYVLDKENKPLRSIDAERSIRFKYYSEHLTD